MTGQNQATSVPAKVPGDSGKPALFRRLYMQAYPLQKRALFLRLRRDSKRRPLPDQQAGLLRRNNHEVVVVECQQGPRSSEEAYLPIPQSGVDGPNVRD